MAKKINGYARDNYGVIEFVELGKPEEGAWDEATLVVGKERVFTETEVRAMRWIPVAEQLPEMVPDGIGWSKSEEVLAMYIDADIRYCKVAYCRTTPEGHIQWIGIKATHWMPLPEAP